MRPISFDAWYHPNRKANEKMRAYPAKVHDGQASERQVLFREPPISPG